MTNWPDIRKRAYHYICERLTKLPAGSGAANEGFIISLDELRSLKEGTSDPSPEIVAFVKRSLAPIVDEAEINANVVTRSSCIDKLEWIQYVTTSYLDIGR